VARYLGGESSSVLATAFDVDRRTATRIVRASGGAVRYRATADVEMARELYAFGFSLAKVGVELGVSARTVLNMFRRAGLATRETGTNQWS
jgi:hypothetical protein